MSPKFWRGERSVEEEEEEVGRAEVRRGRRGRRGRMMAVKETILEVVWFVEARVRV